MNIVIIFLVIIVLLLLYLLFIRYTSAYTLVSSPIFLRNGTTTIANKYIKNATNKTSSYSVWVYLNKQVGTGNVGTIFQLNNTVNFESYSSSKANDPNGVLALYITPANELKFTTKIDLFTIMKNFPLQKWTNVFINIYEMEYYECYINGKLVNTFKKSGAPNAPTGSNVTIILGGDAPDIVVTKLVRNLNTLDALSIWNNYLNGNGMASTTFNASLSISDKEEVIKNYTLFNQN